MFLNINFIFKINLLHSTWKCFVYILKSKFVNVNVSESQLICTLVYNFNIFVKLYEHFMYVSILYFVYMF